MPAPPLICCLPTRAHSGIATFVHIVEKSPNPILAGDMCMSGVFVITAAVFSKEAQPGGETMERETVGSKGKSVGR